MFNQSLTKTGTSFQHHELIPVILTYVIPLDAGVNYVAIEGNDEDRVVVIGDGVDAVSLINLMRKKVGDTDVITVEEVKPNAEKKEEKGGVSEPTQWIYHYNDHPRFIRYETVYEADPPGCSIM